ncbi:MAG: haloacid dehalogenase-like hydrolase [Reichenbachiella sp.]
MKKAYVLFCIVALTSCNQSDQKNEALTKIELPVVSTTLPSWNDGVTKTSIIEFVTAVTTEGGSNYVQPSERIATFDQDGTLWCEQPVAQLEFVSYQIKKMAEIHPEWNNEQPYQSVLEGDKNYLINDYVNNHGRELKKLIVTTHSGMTLEDFNASVKAFMDSSLHPTYNKKYTETVYQPMLELLQYLQDNDFKTYICSGGGNDFMRVFAEDIYGIVPENVIGTFAMNTFEQVDGSWKIVKGTDNFFMNDALTKPAAIEQRIGRIPIFVAGNVRSGGDIGQLMYGKTNYLPNFQLLVNHDDEVREFAYAEKNNASLNAAKEGNWQVVSMKNDWKRIFSF